MEKVSFEVGKMLKIALANGKSIVCFLTVQFSFGSIRIYQIMMTKMRSHDLSVEQ